MKKCGDAEEDKDEKDGRSKKWSLSSLPPAPAVFSFFLPMRNRASSATENATAAEHSRHASSSGRSLEAWSSQSSGAVAIVVVDEGEGEGEEGAAASPCL